MKKLSSVLKKAAKAVWKVRPKVLLCCQIPKPMHGVAPRVILGSKWWNDTREAAYGSTGYHCIACGVSKFDAEGRRWLEGHEIYDIDYLQGRMVYLETVPLCNYCHNFIHDGRLEVLMQLGKITQARYAAVIQHGARVLQAAGLEKLGQYTGPTAEWGDWRLVLLGKEYPPLYADYNAWLAAMERKNAHED